MYLHPLLAKLPAAERDMLVQSSELCSYRRNAHVLVAGEWTDHIYCVANGLLRVVAPSGNDGMEVTTDFIRPDDFFLGPSLSEDRYQTKQGLIAALPSSVYRVPAAALRKLCAKHPEVALGLLGLAMKRMSGIRGQMRSVSSLTSEDLVSRVLRQLTYLAPAGAGRYDKRITQSVIASYSGLSREVVNKTMRELEGKGLVRRDEDGIHVLPEFSEVLGQPRAFGKSTGCSQRI
ncbi:MULTISPECIES: Crp/Fnr family transcriptional regulator [Variovorax]|jgi:CRP/FNR family transcriptional regulator, cyclic AMP receptor protein|uniref:Crp/Fnr family transcriptional regulator n=1 Tax=Variovorax TaxID=34072 RepID=UPI00086DBEA7|nr:MULTISPECIES: Crp/Fnr family transcriptional regulator [Variovorax]MBN8753877.1 Crp/Fnr family transcriptional regulator [Variovorax sp.]ODU18683.1 MAG: Crp/Fnr family transcriptional regulator [Variovorax sp. SCN 67-85]OJZ01416.1 MAG: Crp/Fnr family transcriptional regulator [Variovorax sp. 67-131]UKI11038.1 Crp/Fnr family transcriptional regulator [Variovorax paradoxus]